MTGPQWVSTTQYLQAWQLTADNLSDVAEWCDGRAGDAEGCVDFRNARDDIDTAEIGDWIVRGVTGGHFALPDAVLHEHYQSSGPPPEKPTRGVLTGEPLRITRRT